MCSRIDWHHPQIHTRSVKGKSRTESRYLATCACGHQRWLNRQAARKAETNPCFKCSQRTKAPKGYAAAVEKWGSGFALNKLSAWLIAHPSKLEQQVMSILNGLRVLYEREVRLGNYLLDFVIGRQVIEVNGDIHKFHVERDSRKVQAIREAGYKLLIVQEADMEIAPLLISEFLGLSIHQVAA